MKLKLIFTSVHEPVLVEETNSFQVGNRVYNYIDGFGVITKVDTGIGHKVTFDSGLILNRHVLYKVIALTQQLLEGFELDPAKESLSEIKQSLKGLFNTLLQTSLLNETEVMGIISDNKESLNKISI